MYSGSVYRGRVQSTTLTPTCTPPTPPFLLLEVAPSILQNAVRLASRLLQLLHFTSWLVGLSTSSHAPFFFSPPDQLSLLYLSLCLCPSYLCSGEPDECSRQSVVRARAHPDVTVWLSRTLAQGIWACCNVTVAAQLQANITRHVHLIMTDFYAYFCFWF